ncbi:MAG: FecR family protein [Candidatus Cryptobacteroides sp.]
MLRVCISGASLAACVAAVALFLHFGKTDNDSVDLITCIAEADQLLVLPDGTRVWMDKGSSLTYSESMSEERTVSFKGNAVFDVTPLPDRQEFTINMKGSSIVVHGTSFSVDEKPEGIIDIVLYSGAIDFISSANGQVVSMKPGNALSFNSTSSTIQITPAFDGICWDDGKYVINSASLSSLVEFLQWKYQTNIKISDKIVDDKNFNGVVDYNEELVDIIDSICFMLGLDYKQTTGGYVIF